jgi:hypothetical protein
MTDEEKVELAADIISCFKRATLLTINDLVDIIENYTSATCEEWERR